MELDKLSWSVVSCCPSSDAHLSPRPASIRMSRRARISQELTEVPVPDPAESQYVGRITDIRGSRLCEVFVAHDDQTQLYAVHPKFRKVLYLKRGRRPAGTLVEDVSRRAGLVSVTGP
jgi:hypothetical protein